MKEIYRKKKTTGKYAVKKKIQISFLIITL